MQENCSNYRENLYIKKNSCKECTYVKKYILLVNTGRVYLEYCGNFFTNLPSGSWICEGIFSSRSRDRRLKIV